MKRNDLLTGESFHPSRISQKFARAENRIRYYNQKANSLRHSIMFVNKPLQTNIRILNEIMEGKENAVFHKQFLLGKGYTIGVLTHYHSYQGKDRAAVYHYLIIPSENENIRIIKY